MSEHNRNRYNAGCRCDACRADNTAHHRAMRLRRQAFGKEPPEHGVSGYVNYLCRCDVCKAAKQAQVRDYERRTGRPTGR